MITKSKIIKIKGQLIHYVPPYYLVPVSVYECKRLLLTVNWICSLSFLYYEGCRSVCKTMTQLGWLRCSLMRSCVLLVVLPMLLWWHSLQVDHQSNIVYQIGKLRFWRSRGHLQRWRILVGSADLWCIKIVFFAAFLQNSNSVSPYLVSGKFTVTMKQLILSKQSCKLIPH